MARVWLYWAGIHFVARSRLWTLTRRVINEGHKMVQGPLVAEPKTGALGGRLRRPWIPIPVLFRYRSSTAISTDDLGLYSTVWSSLKRSGKRNGQRGTGLFSPCVRSLAPVTKKNFTSYRRSFAGNPGTTSRGTVRRYRS